MAGIYPCPASWRPLRSLCSWCELFGVKFIFPLPEQRFIAIFNLVRVFKNTWFARFAGKEGITDRELWEMVNQLETGKAYADLGGGVYKMQTARPGESKAGCFRVIVFFKKGERTFFQYAFSKSNRSNIDKKELWLYKRMAKTKLAMSDNELVKAIKAGEVIELQEAK